MLSSLRNAGEILYLFTKADIKTTFLPILVFGIAAAPMTSPARLPHGAFWLWLHLLQFDVANQVLGVAEDARNKADRPLPAGRISLRAATRLRWWLVPACLAYSAAYSLQAVCASAAFAALTLLYNELHADAAHWFVRNSVNGLGFAAFEWGTTLLLRPDGAPLDRAAVLAICQSAGILATTIQVQDFKDVVGDAHVGRRTFPLVAPRAARASVALALPAWAAGLAAAWALPPLARAAFTALALAVGLRFVLRRTLADDRASYQLYNVWLSLAHVLPGYWRWTTR